MRARTLLVEAHSLIADASRRAVSKVGVSLRRKPFPFDLTVFVRINPKLANPKAAAAVADSFSRMTFLYEPLTSAEELALRRLKLTRAERNALRKLIADACNATMFHFFCLMDAVGHPHVVPAKRWQGASFAARKEGPMLHDGGRGSLLGVQARRAP